MVARAGPLATRNCEPRQARKGATAAVDVCAGVGTVWVASISYIISDTAIFQGVYATLAATTSSCMMNALNSVLFSTQLMSIRTK